MPPGWDDQLSLFAQSEGFSQPWTSTAKTDSPSPPGQLVTLLPGKLAVHSVSKEDLGKGGTLGLGFVGIAQFGQVRKTEAVYEL